MFSMPYKKATLITIMFLLFLSLSNTKMNTLHAQVKGRCKDCHTMHYSYEGKPVTYGGQIGPFPILTKGGCIGCHGQNPSGSQNIITIGKARIPQVLHSMRSGDLAGGNFIYVADGYNPDYTKGHNVKGISTQEFPPKDIPMGFIGGVMIPGGSSPTYWPSTKQLTCAGTYGCHGKRTIEDPYESIYGAHHEDDSVIDGTTVGKSYRFLFGVLGVEHKNWEYLATDSDHNGYKGSSNYDSINTISYLCGQCHGKFHSSPNLGGEKEVGYMGRLWPRHPSDFAFRFVNGGYQNSEYLGYRKYDLEVPVAFENPTGKERDIDDKAIVMCLSCHRAHASPYPSILRWRYEDIFVNKREQNGCLRCHTEKAGK